MCEWARKNPDKVRENKRKTDLNNKEKHNTRARVWRLKNKALKAKTDKEYRILNKEKVSLNKRLYYLKNREKLIKANCLRTVERRKIDPLFNLKSKLRTQIIVNLVKRKYKKARRTEELLGADIKVVQSHLESLFKLGMSWENHGKWHIDHIVPLAIAKNEEETLKLFHYKNLQPLWAKENLSKGART